MKFIISGLMCIISTLCFAQKSSLFQVNDSTISNIKSLEEVVVTAEKRQLSPFEIPTALSVVNSRNLQGENAPDLRNLSGIVPNFYMQEGGLKLSTPIYVRGIGTVSGTPPVGLYIDGVPIFDKNAFLFELYDIRQIDVLRGPQTTLYGRNSINGVINIITNTPSNNLSGSVRMGLSSYLSQNYHAVINLPWKNLLNKITASYNRSKGYFRNKYDDNRRSNPTESWNVRYSGLWYSPKDWRIQFGADYNHSYDGGYAYYRIDSLKLNRYQVNYNVPSSYNRDIVSSHLNSQKKWSKTTFSSITSYAWTKDKQLLDADFTYLDVFDNNKKSHQNLVTEEINLQSSQKQKIDWTIGMFGFYKGLTNEYIANFGKDKHLLLPIPLEQANYINETKTWGIAGYGQITVNNLLPGLSLTAGVRYDYEHADLDYRDSVLFANSNAFREFHNSTDKAGFNAWLPKFSALHKWNDHLAVYATISKGYKAGGYNVIMNDMMSKEVDLKYEEEKLWNYEIGMKYKAPAKNFAINASIFFIDWKDQQIFVMGMMGPSIQNAGDAHSFGGEADIQWEFLPGVNYILSAGYNRSRYYHNEKKEHEGNRIVMSPEFTCNTGFQYNKQMNCSLFRQFAASTYVIGFGSQYFDEANTLRQSPYFLWNLETSFSGKRLEVRIWAKNILDKAFFSYMLNNPVGSKLPDYNEMGQSGAPRRIGISLDIQI